MSDTERMGTGWANAATWDVVPIVLVLDASGSMAEHGKHDAARLAVEEMLRDLRRTEWSDAFRVAIITLTDGAPRTTVPFGAIPGGLPAMEPGGTTAIGSALEVLTEVLDDADLPTASHDPLVVLVTDGLPDDGWEEALRSFRSSARGSRALLVAVAVGADADLGMLAAAADEVLHAEDLVELPGLLRAAASTASTVAARGEASLAETHEISTGSA